MRGHLEQRGKGSWGVRVDLPPGPDGRRRQQRVTIRGTRKDAERKLAELLTQVDVGSYVRPHKQTLGEFLRQWHQDYAVMHVRAETAENYQRVIERRLIPGLGHIPLTALQPQHLQAYYAKAMKEGRLDGKGGVSAHTIVYMHGVLSEALSHAVKWGLVVRNVALAVDPPRPSGREMKTLDGVGVRRLLEAAKGTPYYPLIHLAVFTGLRRSELLGLRWLDIDLGASVLSVRQGLHQLRDGRIVFEEPKSAKGKRMVALPSSATLVLRALKERQEADFALLGITHTPETLVACHPDGSPFLPDSVTHAFLKLARRAGLRGVRFHDLRHTHATLLLMQNVHPKIVSERLGHSRIAVTLDTYSHVLPGLQEEAARNFDLALTGSVPAPIEGR